MTRILRFMLLSLLAAVHSHTGAQGLIPVSETVSTDADIISGARQMDRYLPLLSGKRVAIAANQSSMVGSTHLVDTLLASSVRIVKVFSPEHGFRGLVDAGEKVRSETDPRTGLPIVSLYGKNKKPSAEQLADVDVIVFDIQDVGVRFYTYLSTLHYIMEAAAENRKQVIVLDRPNPNGHYIDGPVMEDKWRSFLGLHPVPLVYGMTIGEYARMINGERWLADSAQCELTVVPLSGYDHDKLYQLPVRPSPNLPNMASVYLYPSLGLFEGTMVSVGRGTELPFQVIGHPSLKKTNYTFVPRPAPGAREPKYKGKKCHGFNLQQYATIYMKGTRKINLFWLMGTYENTPDKQKFFDANFNYHAGNSSLQEHIKKGTPEARIREEWEPAIQKFRAIRSKYLLYPDHRS